MAEKSLLIIHDIQEDILTEIQKAAPGWKVTAEANPEKWGALPAEAEIIAGWRRKLLKQIEDNDNLRWIQAWSAGVNSLPLDLLEEKNVMLTSANGVHAYPISETIFGMMLALTRKIDTYIKNQLERKWETTSVLPELHHKTIGIIGTGKIGMETAKIAKAFGMHVIGVRNTPRPEPNIDEMYSSQDLNRVLPACDFVVAALPLTKKTTHMFTAEQFKLMKETAFFINIGRGGLVHEPDLIGALETGTIAGAGLDVFNQEPLPEESPLWGMDRVILTPHTSGATEYYDERLLQEIFIPNLKAYISGDKPALNLLDYSKGY